MARVAHPGSVSATGVSRLIRLKPISFSEDRKDLRVPKSFAQLQALNLLLKKYRDVYPFRIVVCFTTVYLLCVHPSCGRRGLLIILCSLQAFSLPGSMYLSILGGAVWGMPIALPLACTCVATGATLCYLISAALGPALHTLPSWRARFDTWSAKIAAQRENLIPFLILLRLAPLPPHWVVNVLCPHVGIGIVPFWCTTWLGILGVTVIHTRLGQTLDEMTSAEDFHLISWKNFFGLAAIVVGVLIPVAFRFYFKKENEGVVGAADATGEAEEHLFADDEESQLSAGDRVLAAGPSRADGQKRKSVTFAPYSDGEDEFSEVDEPEDEDDDDDLVLEVGPDVRPKGKARDDSGPSSSSALVRG
jgi:uncharacterized membrane protein YdjX (TVP38/TMEM64 family)